ncbi:hypothetical protein QQ045_027066 [Rhodiola kirilowii]
MADCGSFEYRTAKCAKPISSIFFNSPRLFTGLTPDSQLLMSPTSILDSIPFSGFRNPFSSESSVPKSTPEPDHRRWTNMDSNKVGLSILDSLEKDSTSQTQSKPESRMVLFGSQLKIQIPLHQPYSGDFGIKTKACHPHPSVRQQSPTEIKSTGVFSGCLSPTELELSEDYTCVISHGTNPKTTHIYDNCIVKSCCGVSRSLLSLSASTTERNQNHHLPEDFLSHCYTCGIDLSIGKDIYMYKGEKAFCSSECRYEEMLLDEDDADSE